MSPIPSAQSPPAAPWQAPRAARAGGPALFAATLVVLFLLLASVGLPPGVSRISGMIAALSAAVGGLITPTLYLIACFGMGRPFAAALAQGSGCRLHLQLALGVGAMLWLSHILGVPGLLSDHGPLGPSGSRIAAWAAVGVGLAILADQVARGELRPERWPVLPISLVLWTPALALLGIAASNPPLALWESEFGGYDALSYHLQLAKEWAAGPQGRVWPVEHNVYSFLPSYMEAAFTHLGAMSLGRGSAITRMFGADGHWVYSCQFLHMGMGVVAALLIARMIRLLGERAGASTSIAAFSGAAGAALFLATPWTIVVGSLAYNELAMIAMAAGAMLAAADPALPAWRRGAIAGLLVGVACSAKPTALILVGPAAGVGLFGWLGANRVREAAVTIVAGIAGGLLAIGPWLVRNALASGGNPVFPFWVSRLGGGHWTEEQVARYARAHTSDLSLGERLWLLVSPRGASGGVVTGQARGLGHDQWSIVPWIALVSLAIVLMWRPARRSGMVFGLGAMLTIVAWMAFTHVQSRFLLPLVVPFSALFGLGACAVLVGATRRVRRRAPEDVSGKPPAPILAAAVIGVLPLTVAGWSAINFMRQHQAQPNRLLVVGAGGLSGMLFESALRTATPEERRSFFDEQAQPQAYMNLAWREPDGESRMEPGGPTDIYLLGDAAPLYYVDALGEPDTAPGGASLEGAGVHITYHTTWDNSPLGDAMAAAPDEPEAWSKSMIAHGFGFVLVNYGELIRLIEKDHNYDPRVTGERVRAWLAPSVPGGTGLQSVRRWTMPADAGGGGRKQFVSHELFRIGAIVGDKQP